MAKAAVRSASLAPPNIPPNAVRVLCVDDHVVLVEGLKAHFAVDHGIVCVGSLQSADRLCEEFHRLQPDVALLDIEMPGADVFEAAHRLRRMQPDARFLFLSAHVRSGYLAAAYKCGASGYFAKSDSLDVISAGIKEVARSADGTFVMGSHVRDECQPVAGGALEERNVERRRRRTGPATVLDSLTPRELDVLRLIGKGLSRLEIAHELARSAKTIDRHQDRLMKKLQLHTRADLVRLAIREGLAEA